LRGNLIPEPDPRNTLRYEEIARVVQAAATLGVTKIRLTGGEPLVRLHLDRAGHYDR